MIKICFVCTGNTCRSVMAERIMKKKLKQLAIKDIKVSSKGLYANGENITENAQKSLKTLKASAANRKSVKLKKLDAQTLYITMTEGQKQRLNSSNSMSFKSILGYEIVDPYGQDEQVYLQTAKQIEKGVEILINKIKEWRKL